MSIELSLFDKLCIDIADRRDLKSVWKSIDPDTMHEIRKAWEVLFDEEFARRTKQPDPYPGWVVASNGLATFLAGEDDPGAAIHNGPVRVLWHYRDQDLWECESPAGKLSARPDELSPP